MSRSLALASALLAWAIAAPIAAPDGEAGASSAGADASEATGSIRVRVTDERTGRPVPGARVIPRRVGEEVIGGAVRADPQTDEYGAALLEGLAPGRYQVHAWRNGLALREEGKAEVRAGETAQATVVLASAPGTDVEVSVRPAGVPLDGAEVFLERLRGEPRYHEKKVLEGGRQPVVFRAVPFGRYLLRASHAAYPASPRREVDISPGADRFELELQAPPGGWVPVFGRVLDEEGRGVQGARVYFSTPTASARYEAETDVSGRFSVAAVAPGTYSGEASASATGLRTSRRRFEVRPPETGEVVFTLLRGAEVTGTVGGLPPELLTDVGIRALADEPTAGVQGSAAGSVEADGTYRLEGVTPGTWSIQAGVGAAGVSAPLTVPEGARTVAGPDLLFPDLHTVAGRLLYQGEPYAEVSVGLQAEDAPPAAPRGMRIPTGPDGRFTFEGVSPGSYRLTVVDSGWGRVHNEVLEVTEDVERAFALGAARASGEVLDAVTGVPVPEARVQLGQPDATYRVSHALPSWAELDAEARFEVGPLEEGRWSLEASADGYVPEELVIDIQGEDLEGLVIPLTPTPGLDLLVRTTAGDVPGKIELRLRDPEAGCTVAEEALYPHGIAEVRWPDAPPGEWRLLVRDRTGACVEVEASVPGPPVEVVLPALARLEVRVPELEGRQTEATLQLLDQDGRPVAARGCHGTGRERWELRGNRRFYAFSLEPGHYRARVSTADGRSWSGSVEVRPGLDNSLVLR